MKNLPFNEENFEMGRNLIGIQWLTEYVNYKSKFTITK